MAEKFSKGRKTKLTRDSRFNKEFLNNVVTAQKMNACIKNCSFNFIPKEYRYPICQKRAPAIFLIKLTCTCKFIMIIVFLSTQT